MKQLTDLVKRIPDSYVKTKPGGFQADYVSHADIQQILLAKLGPCSQEVTRVITNAEGVVQGCVLRVAYQIDGEMYVIEEAGDVERPGANNGANLKNAVSMQSSGVQCEWVLDSTCGHKTTMCWTRF